MRPPSACTDAGILQLASSLCLIVNDMKLGDSEGAVALFGGPATEGYFANLKITQARALVLLRVRALLNTWRLLVTYLPWERLAKLTLGTILRGPGDAGSLPDGRSGNYGVMASLAIRIEPFHFRAR